MSFINYDNYRFFLMDGRNQRTDILKAYDPLVNLSSLPMYETDGGTRFPVFMAIISIMSDYNKESKGASNGLDSTETQLCLLLITKALMEKHRDYKVLEIGCGDGALSFPVARLLKEFNPKYHLVCATDDMNMDLVNRWYERLALSGAEGAVSLLASKHVGSLFPRDYFDITLINGAAQFGDPAKVICAAVNSVRTGGLLICLTANQFLLNSGFQAIVENCTEYYLSNTSSVLVKTVGGKDHDSAYKRTDEYKNGMLKQDIADVFIALKDTINNLSSAGDDRAAAVDDMIKAVMRSEESVLSIFGLLESRYIKFNISELKESLISYRLCRDEPERKHFAAVCGEKYQAVINEMKKYSDFVI